MKTEMIDNKGRYRRATMLVALLLIVVAASSQLRADNGTCSGVQVNLPFTDIQGNAFFCQIASAYFSGLTNGTSATTYSPTAPVAREQMAAFVSRTLDQSVKRGSKRAALDQWWTPQVPEALGTTTVGNQPQAVKTDGDLVWVANFLGNSVSCVQASDGKLLKTYTGVTKPRALLIARGMIYVAGDEPTGKLYSIDPTSVNQTTVTFVENIGSNPIALAYDGEHIWCSNFGGNLYRIGFDPDPAVTTRDPGLGIPTGLIYDGSELWVIDQGSNKLKRLGSGGTLVAQEVSVGGSAQQPVFDGTNIWVPNFNDDTITVIRASTGAVLATLSGNGLNGPGQAAFDGERILVVNKDGHSVSLWKATDLTPLGSISTGATGGGSSPAAVCSDGLNFWITLSSYDKLARF
jgi:DNA-binding beta-propeller fold protein YncE